jgi:hypothetical protein
MTATEAMSTPAEAIASRQAITMRASPSFRALEPAAASLALAPVSRNTRGCDGSDACDSVNQD